MGRFDVIKNLIDEGEEFTFQYYDFEFLIADIDKESNTFIVKVYCPIDVSYSVECLENAVDKEITKILKYFNLDKEHWGLKLYSGEEPLNDGYYHHFTQEFVDELLKKVEQYKKFEYLLQKTKRQYYLTIEQEPYKVYMESNGSQDVNIIIYSNLIRAYRTYTDTGEVEDASVDICNNWFDVLETELDFEEEWRHIGSLYDMVNTNYLSCTYFDIFSSYSCT